MTSTVHLLLGSNVGDRQANLEQAIQEIEHRIGTVLKASARYETTPWGFEKQDLFLNQALVIATKLSPPEVLAVALVIQDKHAVVKSQKYGPRMLDIDIIFYENKVIRSRKLTLPHPRMHKRNFVLIPLDEIAGDIVHPIFNKTVHELALACTDRGEVRLYKHDGD